MSILPLFSFLLAVGRWAPPLSCYQYSKSVLGEAKWDLIDQTGSNHAVDWEDGY